MLWSSGGAVVISGDRHEHGKLFVPSSIGFALTFPVQ